MSETQEAQIVEFKRQPSEVSVIDRRARDVAGACREIVLKTAMPLGNRKFVRVEGWQTIAAMFGCSASIESVEEVPGGIKAIAAVHVPGRDEPVRGEGFVGDDEHLWAGCPAECRGHADKRGQLKRYERRPLYARRAMAQTRAISRVCRNAFAFVVVMIDAGLSTTPAEEMDGVTDAEPIDNAAAPPAGIDGLKARVAAAQAAQAANAPPKPTPARARKMVVPGAVAAHDRTATIGFGYNKHTALGELDEGALRWYLGSLEENVADPAKAKYVEQDRAKLALVRAEMTFRGLT